MKREYQICTRCIMDTTDPDITFNENGVCNHCRGYDELVKKYVFPGKGVEQKFNEIVDKIKEYGSNQEYDCVIGLSGGKDSSYVAYLVEKLRLRPLAITVDNGWDSEIAKNNVRNIVKNLNFDLHTYVVDWNEFRDLQLAYLKASVVNIEAITDYLIRACLYNVSNKRGIKYILGGTNIVTEGILPESWGYNTNDLVNLKDIHKHFGKVKLKSFPTLGLFRLLYLTYVKKIEYVPILNYVSYNKEEVKRLLAKELNWRGYGNKHYESIFTRFYQAYILPRKFNIDKRKAHLSTLICSGQITREQALIEMGKKPYLEEDLKRDKEYVIKKLGLTDEEFEKIMNFPVKSHYDYKTNTKWVKSLRLTYRIFKKIVILLTNILK